MIECSIDNYNFRLNVLGEDVVHARAAFFEHQKFRTRPKTRDSFRRNFDLLRYTRHVFGMQEQNNAELSCHIFFSFAKVIRINVFEKQEDVMKMTNESNNIENIEIRQAYLHRFCRLRSLEVENREYIAELAEQVQRKREKALVSVLQSITRQANSISNQQMT